METNYVTNYKESLSQLLSERRKANSRYSIRALARDLQIDPSDLINILNDKKRVTPKVAYRIGLKLNLQDSSLLEFLRPTLS